MQINAIKLYTAKNETMLPVYMLFVLWTKTAYILVRYSDFNVICFKVTSL